MWILSETLFLQRWFKEEAVVGKALVSQIQQMKIIKSTLGEHPMHLLHVLVYITDKVEYTSDDISTF